MRIHFSAEELAHLEIHTEEREALSPGYLSERERIWQSRTQRAASRGDQLWNGEAYVVAHIFQPDEENISVQLTTCEYKDIVMRQELGAAGIASAFGKEHVFRFVTVDCIPVTSDGYGVFGVRARGTQVNAGWVGLIGGTLNRDEQTVQNAGDLEEFMIRELVEETSMPRPRSIRLYALNLFREKYEFLYTFRLEETASQIAGLHKAGEFDRLIALRPGSPELERSAGADAFRYCRTYLRDLLVTTS